MGLSCGLTCLKYTLFVLNFFGWLVGIAIFGVAIWILTDDDFSAYADAMNFEYYYAGCYIFLAAGLLIIIIGFLGCCGAITENVGMLTAYFFCLVVIFLLEIAAAIYVLVVGISYTSLDKWVEKNLYIMLYNYNDDDIKWVMDDLQSTLKCCGVKSSYDYEAIGLPTPDSCRDPITGNQYPDDCYDKFIDYISSKSGLIAGLAITVACVHIASMVMSMCLCMGLKKADKEMV